MKKPAAPAPRCIIIAGPNGAGKTTFARRYLLIYASIVHFVNADLIASGLSPLKPELVTLAAGRIFLAELDRLAKARVDFAFETTLSGLVYRERLKRWKKAGYRIEIVFLRLPSPGLAIRRIADRVKQGGHHVPHADVLRRFARGWANSKKFTNPLRTRGLCMIIRQTVLSYWRPSDETYKKRKTRQTRRRHRPCFTSRSEGRPQDGPGSWHADSHLAGWEDRRGKAVRFDALQDCSS